MRLKIDFKMAGKQIIRGISWLLTAAGVLIFFFGDRALHEFYKFGLFNAELVGIVSGIVLMIAGAGLKLAIGDRLGKRAG